MPDHDDGSLASPAAFMSELYDNDSSPLASESAFELTHDDFSLPISMSDHDCDGSSPAVSMSEDNDGASAITSPVPSEPVPRPSSPSSSPRVDSSHTASTDSQNIGSRQEKNPLVCSPTKASHNSDDSERTSARCDTSVPERTDMFMLVFAVWSRFKRASNAILRKTGRRSR